LGRAWLFTIYHTQLSILCDVDDTKTIINKPMEEKRKDLKSSRQKKLVQEIVQRLSSEQPSLYYMPTIEVAAAVKEFIHKPGNLPHEQLDVVKALTRRDIQILLSLH